VKEEREAIGKGRGDEKSKPGKKENRGGRGLSISEEISHP